MSQAIRSPAQSSIRMLSRIVAHEAAELVSPTRCIGCEAPGTLLCPRCRSSLEFIQQFWACPDCGAPYGWLACTGCKHDWPELRSVVCALSYAGPAARMVVGLKDEHEIRLAPIMAAALACAIDEASGWPASDGEPRINLSSLDALCYVPATRSARLKRGFDHMALVADALSQFCGLPVASVLHRASTHDQRILTREQRQANVFGTTSTTGDVSGLHLLLVDDVVTTGASMRACAQALLGRGAKSVTGLGFARVW